MTSRRSVTARLAPNFSWLITYFSENWKDELEAELEELEGAELESQLLEPVAATRVHPVQVPANKQPTRPVPQKSTAEDDELAALQAEMALWSGYRFIICSIRL
jgi:hypothetical protein